MVPFALKMPVVTVRASVVIEFEHAKVASHHILSKQAEDTIVLWLLFQVPQVFDLDFGQWANVILHIDLKVIITSRYFQMDKSEAK